MSAMWRAVVDGRLLDDNFYSGREFDLGLNRYAPEIFSGDLRLEILPLRRYALIFLEPKAKPDFGGQECLVKLQSVEIVNLTKLNSEDKFAPIPFRMKNNIPVVFLLVMSVCACTQAFSLPGGEPDRDLTLWYQQPAADKQPMNEALPIGNGRMGALIFGAPERERISVNEDSLWTGGENPSGDYDTMGAYQVLGNVFVNLPGHTNVADYRRDLDIWPTPCAHVSYTANGVSFQREYFCSHPAEVLAAQFTANKKGAYTGSIELADSHDAKIVTDGNRLTASGTLNNGMKFEWQLLVQNHGGSVTR